MNSESVTGWREESQADPRPIQEALLDPLVLLIKRCAILYLSSGDVACFSK